LNNIKHKLKRLDINIAYACNIKCSGCISLSDFARKGVASVEEIQSWLEYWHTYLDIDVIVLFGGEPLIHPHLLDVCTTIRKYYPASTIRLITNGYLLDNFEPDSWFQFAPFEIQVSIHRLDHESVINEKIKKIIKTKPGWTTAVEGLNKHQQIKFNLDNFSIYKSKFQDFVAPYGLVDNRPMALKSDPVRAHSICGSPNTPVLYKGKLYKCPPVANLIDYLGENWNNYKSCDQAEDLDAFVNQIGCPESVCAQCPDNTNAIIFDHFDKENVRVKEKYTS
jgi:MoaA/NifB/PqqE/SkfB family radical SAM enzyme